MQYTFLNLTRYRYMGTDLSSCIGQWRNMAICADGGQRRDLGAERTDITLDLCAQPLRRRGMPWRIAPPLWCRYLATAFSMP